MAAVLAPGSVVFVPLVSGLVGGSQVQTEAQVAPQEEAQHHDKAYQEEDPWEGQEQVLNKEDRVNNLQVSEVIDCQHQEVGEEIPGVPGPDAVFHSHTVMVKLVHTQVTHLVLGLRWFP